MTEPINPSETPRERVQPVIGKLREMTHDSVRPLLDARHDADPLAGIAIAPLEGEIETADGAYHFHAARVFTSSPEHPNYVNPHYHEIGEEPYVILDGSSGEMNTGRVVDGKVVWDEPKTVSSGETIIVEEGQVHSLRNTGEEPLDFVFGCPDNHLVDHSDTKPEGDRYFTKDLPDGIPPHYPQSK